MKRCALLLFLILPLAACASERLPPSGREAAAPNAISRWNLELARDYMAQGRYELAKERYLLALASNTNPKLHVAIAQGLKSADTMIQTLR